MKKFRKLLLVISMVVICLGTNVSAYAKSNDTDVSLYWNYIWIYTNWMGIEPFGIDGIVEVSADLQGQDEAASLSIGATIQRKERSGEWVDVKAFYVHEPTKGETAILYGRYAVPRGYVYRTQFDYYAFNGYGYIEKSTDYYYVDFL